MNDDPYIYLELIASASSTTITTHNARYVLRALSVRSLAELVADLTAARDRDDDIEDVLATYAVAYD